MADRAGAQFVAILGDQELASGTVTLRRLVDGVQKSVPTADLAGWLTKLDGWVD
jgi:histidyl-tRNA synthetase